MKSKSKTRAGIDLGAGSGPRYVHTYQDLAAYLGISRNLVVIIKKEKGAPKEAGNKIDHAAWARFMSERTTIKDVVSNKHESDIRLTPTFEGCAPVKALVPETRTAATTSEIDFPGFPFVINGANARSKLQYKPIRWLILDEVRNYPPEALSHAIEISSLVQTGGKSHVCFPCVTVGRKVP